MSERLMEVVFLTGFTDGCFRSIPAVAQMADDLAMRLTLLHAYDPREARQSVAEDRLASFYPEADRYAGTRRVAFAGTVVETALAYGREHPVDLFVAPGVDRLRPLHVGRSTRAALIAASPAPVWTIGSKVFSAGVRRPARRIACWLDPAAKDAGYLTLASEIARNLDGELHILHAVSEGGVSGPRHADDVVEVVTRELGGGRVAGVHVSPGGWPGAVLDLVRDCDPDLLVLSPRRSVRRLLLGARVGSLVDRVACPVLCVGEKATVPQVLPGYGLTDVRAAVAAMAQA